MSGTDAAIMNGRVRRAAEQAARAARVTMRASTRASAGADPAAPASALSLTRKADRSTLLASPPSDASALGYGFARGTVPSPPRGIVARLVGELQFDPEVFRYAERRTAAAFEAFDDVRAVDILLGGGNGSVTCRLHIAFVRGRAVIVGHSGSTILHTIDTAIETAAHIVRSQADRQR